MLSSKRIGSFVVWCSMAYAVQASDMSSDKVTLWASSDTLVCWFRPMLGHIMYEEHCNEQGLRTLLADLGATGSSEFFSGKIYELDQVRGIELALFARAADILANVHNDQDVKDLLQGLAKYIMHDIPNSVYVEPVMRHVVHAALKKKRCKEAQQDLACLLDEKAMPVIIEATQNAGLHGYIYQSDLIAFTFFVFSGDALYHYIGDTPCTAVGPINITNLYLLFSIAMILRHIWIYGGKPHALLTSPLMTVVKELKQGSVKTPSSITLSYNIKNE